MNGTHALHNDTAGTWLGIERSTIPFFSSSVPTNDARWILNTEYFRGRQWLTTTEWDYVDPDLEMDIGL